MKKKCCIHCGDDLTPERAEVYEHCMKKDCVDAWMVARRRNMAIDLIPKSGFRIVYRNN